MRTSIFCALVSLVVVVVATENNQLNFIKKLHGQCHNRTDPIKCYKIKALKFAERVGKAKKLEVFEGLEVLQDLGLDVNRTGRVVKSVGLDEEVLEDMDGDVIDDMLYQAAYNFLETHTISLNLPKMVEKARRLRRKNRYGPALMAALALKGLLMSMAYKSIAVMAGTALIIGKMALVLAAILGLKKLVSGDKEKTTVEVIKHPTHSTSHTYSSSLEEVDGHYHRSMGSPEEMVVLERLFRNLY